MRGTGLFNIPEITQVRITPACAGNRSHIPHGYIHCGDHPRVCGEQCPRLLCLIYVLGSPPRVRGTVFYSFLYVRIYRITPACAGNRYYRGSNCQSKEDHPRVCGEQWYCFIGINGVVGSPPRVRGTVRDIKSPNPSFRITPACAGNRCRK